MIIIVQYSPDDQSEVKKLIISILNEFGFKYDPKHTDSDLENPMKFYQGGIFYVLMDNNNIVGTVAVLRVDEKTLKLKRLFLKKDSRGKGLGLMLLKKAVKFCKTQNFNKIFLHTSPKFKTAIRLYKKFGFQIAKNDAGDGCKLVLEMKL